MSHLKGKRILIFQQRGWGKGIGRFLARKLYNEGCQLAALTSKKTTHELIINQTDVKYELIISNDEVMSDPKKYLNGDIFPLEDICNDLGINSIWPIVQASRMHVRSYKDKYYYSYKQNVSDEGIIEYVMAIYKYIKIIFDKFNPEVIISPNFVSVYHIMMSLYARKRGVTMVGVTDSKVKGIFIFCYGHQDDKGRFHDWIDELNSGKKDSVNREKAKIYIKEFREQFKKPSYANYEISKKSLTDTIKQELFPYYSILMWYLKKQINVLKSTGISVDYRPPKIILRDHYCHKRYTNFAQRFNYYSLNKINKFVYFPLQFQPEAAIDVIAPFFNNQLETVRQVAMSMPADYTLVVKDHPGMIGLRPSSYIEKIARTVNVKLIDYRISTKEVLEKCSLVISPGSTTLAEAALLSRPAIQLGNLGTTLKLPNVCKHTDMTNLDAKIKEVLKMDLNSEEYEKRLENYVAAAYDTGFDIDYITAWERGNADLYENLWHVYKEELERIFLNHK